MKAVAMMTPAPKLGHVSALEGRGQVSGLDALTREQVDEARDAPTRLVARDDGEGGQGGRNDEDDKDGRDSHFGADAVVGLVVVGVAKDVLEDVPLAIAIYAGSIKGRRDGIDMVRHLVFRDIGIKTMREGGRQGGWQWFGRVWWSEEEKPAVGDNMGGRCFLLPV
jgi:hypothetical protein